MPTIKIDNQSDPFATIVKVDFGNKLGDLLDTVRTLIRCSHHCHALRCAHADPASLLCHFTSARTCSNQTGSCMRQRTGAHQ